jgi:hypothetical protein
MRQLTALVVSVGVLAAPAVAQYQPPNISGSWGATLDMGNGPLNIRIDLAQDGNRIAGHEQIILGDDRGVAIRISGGITGDRRTGARLPQVLSSSGGCPHHRPGEDSRFLAAASTMRGVAQGITFARIRQQQGPNISRNRPRQTTAGENLLGLLLLGAMIGDSGPSSSPSTSYSDQASEKAEWQFRYEQGCVGGNKGDCYEANKDRLFPDKEQ